MASNTTPCVVDDADAGAGASDDEFVASLIDMITTKNCIIAELKEQNTKFQAKNELIRTNGRSVLDRQALEFEALRNELELNKKLTEMAINEARLKNVELQTSLNAANAALSSKQVALAGIQNAHAVAVKKFSEYRTENTLMKEQIIALEEIIKAL